MQPSLEGLEAQVDTEGVAAPQREVTEKGGSTT